MAFLRLIDAGAGHAPSLAGQNELDILSVGPTIGKQASPNEVCQFQPRWPQASPDNEMVQHITKCVLSRQDAGGII